MLEITEDNYYSQEAQMAYMGSTQYKDFCSCEARALATIRGEYVRPVSTALLIGSYVDAYFAGELEPFTATHPELFKKNGELKAEYLHAETIIRKMESSRLFSMLMSGRKQVIKTGLIAGVPFKIKIDSLLDSDICAEIAKEFPAARPALGLLDGAIVDQKVVKDFLPIWSEEERQKIPFVEFWGYDLQGAIYQEIDGRMLPFIIAAGTKEQTPDLGAFYIPDDDLRCKLAEVEENAPRFHAIKQGRITPRRCEKCDYCNSTRDLTKIVPYNETEEVVF